MGRGEGRREKGESGLSLPPYPLTLLTSHFSLLLRLSSGGQPCPTALAVVLQHSHTPRTERLGIRVCQRSSVVNPVKFRGRGRGDISEERAAWEKWFPHTAHAPPARGTRPYRLAREARDVSSAMAIRRRPSQRNILPIGYRACAEWDALVQRYAHLVRLAHGL